MTGGTRQSVPPRDRHRSARQIRWRTAMIHLKKLGHVLLRAADQERSTRFYTEVLGFKVSEHLPNDAAFLTLGDDFHTFDIAQQGMSMPGGVGSGGEAGLGHIAFQVDSYS